MSIGLWLGIIIWAWLGIGIITAWGALSVEVAFIFFFMGGAPSADSSESEEESSEEESSSSGGHHPCFFLVLWSYQ